MCVCVSFGHYQLLMLQTPFGKQESDHVIDQANEIVCYCQKSSAAAISKRKVYRFYFLGQSSSCTTRWRVQSQFLKRSLFFIIRSHFRSRLFGRVKDDTSLETIEALHTRYTCIWDWAHPKKLSTKLNRFSFHSPEKYPNSRYVFRLILFTF